MSKNFLFQKDIGTHFFCKKRSVEEIKIIIPFSEEERAYLIEDCLGKFMMSIEDFKDTLLHFEKLENKTYEISMEDNGSVKIIIDEKRRTYAFYITSLLFKDFSPTKNRQLELVF